MSSEPVSSDLYASSDFWEDNKTKILAYGILLIVVLGGYGIYFVNSQRKEAAAKANYAAASSAAELQAVVRDYAGSRVAGDASLQLADKLREEKKYGEAETVLLDFIAKNPDHPLVGGAWISLASTYEFKGKLDKALDTYQQAATKFPNAYTAPIALVSQGRILIEQKKPDDAKRIYEDVVARYPDSIFARESMRELRFLKR